MRKKNELPATNEIRTAFDYNPETGILKWRTREGIDRGTNVFNGAFAGKATGCPSGTGYLRVLWGKHYVAHRLIWKHYYGEEPTELDHINGKRDDNRIANLREATASQNMVNSRNRPPNKTGFRGVFLTRGGRFYAATRQHGKIHYLGTFDTALEAAAAYKTGARLLHGDFLP